MIRKTVFSCLLLCLSPFVHSEEVIVDPIPQQTLLQYLAGKEVFALIDARSPEEYAAGHVWGAVNVPHDAALSDAALPEDRSAPLVVYCKSGLRALSLQRRLEAAGYSDVKVLAPAQMMWADELPVFNCGAEEPQPQVLTAVDPLKP